MLLMVATLATLIAVSVIAVAMPVDEQDRQRVADSQRVSLESAEERHEDAVADLESLAAELLTLEADPLSAPSAIREVEFQVVEARENEASTERALRQADLSYTSAEQRSRDSNDWLIAASSLALLLAVGVLGALAGRVSNAVISAVVLVATAAFVAAAPIIDANPSLTSVLHRLALLFVGLAYLLGLSRVLVSPRQLIGPNRLDLGPFADLLKLAGLFVGIVLFVGFANLVATSIGVNDGWVNTIAQIPGAILGLTLVVISGVPLARLAVKLSRWNFGNHVAPWMLRFSRRYPRLATLWLFASPWSVLLGIVTPLLLLYRNTAENRQASDSAAALDQLPSPGGGIWGLVVVLPVLWLLSFLFPSIHRQGLRWWISLWQPKVTHDTQWSRLVEKMSAEERRMAPFLRDLVANSVAGQERAHTMNRWWIGLMNPTLEALAVPSDRPLLILGPTGSGKTTSVVLQNAILHDGPMVITSTKDELMLQLSGGFGRDGRRCYVFDPLETVVNVPDGVQRVSWNPLGGCTDWERARKRAILMVGAASAAKKGSSDGAADFWDATAADTLAALFFGCAMTGRDLRDLLDIVSTLGDSGSEGTDSQEERVTAFGHLADDVYRQLHSDEHSACRDELRMCLSALGQVEQVASSGGTTASSLHLSVARALSALRSVKALRMLMDRSSALDTHALVAGGGVVFLVSETEDQTLTAPLFVGLIDEIVQQTYLTNRSSAGSVETLLLLDELAQLAPLKNLPALVAEGRGKGLRILAVLQDLAQAGAVWGDEGKAFTSKFPYLVVLPGVRDKDLLESLELIAGRYDHRFTTNSYSQQHSFGLSGRQLTGSLARTRTVSESQERRSALEAGAIAAMAPGQALFFANTVGLDRGWSEIWLTPTYSNEPFRQPFGDYLDQPAVQAPIDLTGTPHAEVRAP